MAGGSSTLFPAGPPATVAEGNENLHIVYVFQEGRARRRTARVWLACWRLLRAGSKV